MWVSLTCSVRRHLGPERKIARSKVKCRKTMYIKYRALRRKPDSRMDLVCSWTICVVHWEFEITETSNEIALRTHHSYIPRAHNSDAGGAAFHSCAAVIPVVPTGALSDCWIQPQATAGRVVKMLWNQRKGKHWCWREQPEKFEAKKLAFQNTHSHSDCPHSKTSNPKDKENYYRKQETLYTKKKHISLHEHNSSPNNQINVQTRKV